MPERPFLRVVWACGVTGSRADATIFFLNKLRRRQMFLATVAPLIPHLLVQAFSESFRQSISYSFGHDRVVVIMLGAESVAQLFQANSAGYRECTDVIRQRRFFGRDEVTRDRHGSLPSLFAC